MYECHEQDMRDQIRQRQGKHQPNDNWSNVPMQFVDPTKIPDKNGIRQWLTEHLNKTRECNEVPYSQIVSIISDLCRKPVPPSAQISQLTCAIALWISLNKKFPDLQEPYPQFCKTFAYFHNKKVTAILSRHGNYSDFDLYSWLGENLVSAAKALAEDRGNSLRELLTKVKIPNDPPILPFLTNLDYQIQDFLTIVASLPKQIFQFNLQYSVDVWSATAAPSASYNFSQWFHENHLLRRHLQDTIKLLWDAKVIKYVEQGQDYTNANITLSYPAQGSQQGYPQQ